MLETFILFPTEYENMRREEAAYDKHERQRILVEAVSQAHLKARVAVFGRFSSNRESYQAASKQIFRFYVHNGSLILRSEERSGSIQQQTCRCSERDEGPRRGVADDNL